MAFMANRLWLLSQEPEYRRFIAACGDVRAAQEGKLAGYLRRNADTAFGRTHGFARLAGPRDYARVVPLQDWDSLRPWVERAARGEPAVLSAAPITRLEPTSGTSSAAKFIPATSDRRGEIGRAVAAWMGALFRQVPRAFAGTAYWSISPAVMDPVPWPGSRIPVGHARDTEYLDPLSAFLMRRIMAVPESLAALRDPDAFYRQTLNRLLADGGLGFVSVWSPTFLLRLDDMLRAGDLDLPRALAESGLASKARLRFVERALRPGFTWLDLWPGLAAASCWTHAESALFTRQVQAALGPVRLQPKGLMATEGVTSIPLIPDADPCLAVNSHFFEFLPQGSGNGEEAVTALSLEQGGCYEVVLTTGGGLYRYRTGDLVRITGRFRQAPALRFLGRNRRVSDLAGEKITEVQAIEALDRIRDPALDARGTFLHPRLEPGGHIRYGLFLIRAEGKTLDTRAVDRAAEEVEKALARNPYYSQARALGQLQAVRAEILDAGFSGRMAQRRGNASAQAGSAKLPALFPHGSLDGLIGVSGVSSLSGKGGMSDAMDITGPACPGT